MSVDRTGNKPAMGRGTKNKRLLRAWELSVAIGLMGTTTLPFSGAALAQAAESGITIRVRVNNYSHASLPRVSEAERVAGRILGASGLRIVWLDCSVAHCQEPLESTDIGLRILSQPKSNEFPDTVFGFANAPALASVYYNYALRRARSDNAEFEVPILLGCVIAHEIGHLLLGPKAHSAEGIMQPRWQPREIQQATRGWLLFTSSQSKSMRIQVQARAKPKMAVAAANIDVAQEGVPTSVN